MILLSLLFLTSAAIASGDPPPTPELTLDVVADQKPVQLSAPESTTPVTRETILTLPGGEETSLPHLLSETIPGAVSGAQERLFFRQNEFGMRFEVDGILLPDQPSNALAEPFSPRFIEQVKAVTGALPAEYGEGAQSVVSIETRGGDAIESRGGDAIEPRGKTERPRADIEMAYGSYRSAWPEASVWGGGDSFHYFLGGAYWRTDRGLGTPDPASSTDLTQGGTDPVHDQAHGNNEFLKMDWKPATSDRLTLMASNSMAFYQIPNYPSSFLPTDPLFNTGDSYGNDPYNYAPSATNDTQSETSDFVQATWTHDFADHSRLRTSLFYTYYLVQVDNDPPNDLAALNLVTGTDANPTSFAENRNVNSLGLQADYTDPLSDSNHLHGGVRERISRAAGDLAVTEQDPSNAGSLLTVGDASPETGTFTGIYIEDEQTLWGSFKIMAGIRYEEVQYHYADSAPNFDQFEPRLGLSYMATPETKVHAYYGRLFLPAPVEDLHDVFNSLQAGTLGIYDIKPETDNYYEVGVDQALPVRQSLHVTVYYKDATNLLDDAQLLNTSLSQQFNWAHGYAYGVEASVRGKITPNLSDYVNYGYGIAKGEGLNGGLFVFAPGQAPGSSYQLLDHVQKHTLTVGSTYSQDGAWGTLEALFGSGLPTGPTNNITLPSHLTFNLSAGYRLAGNDWYSGFRLGADLINVFNDVYPISVANGFNGSYYAAGREFVVRVGKEL